MTLRLPPLFPLAAALGSKAAANSAPTSVRPAAERAEQHRLKGNEWFGRGAYEEVR